MQAGTDLEALIEASRRGDRDAFATIIVRHHRAVYAVAFSGVRDRALADDVTQDTFVHAWRRLDDLRDPARLAAWLCGIARNLARDARRRLQRETLGDVDEPVDATTPYEALTDAESERVLAAGLEQVPELYREPLVLFYYQDRSVEDVAHILGISAATTNKRLSRGRRQLAERVANIVEHGLARRGPSPALVASVLAAIAVTLPAAHVDASPSKGSIMSKLTIAAVLATTLGGAGLLAATAMRAGDAHAGPDHAGASAPTAPAHEPGSATAAVPAACPLDMLRTHAAAISARLAPSLSSPAGAASAPSQPANDCTAVGRHLAELEADATHGAEHRPDEATCDKCAGHYTTQCDDQGWNAERRACVLAAGDLINAQLCPATGGATSPLPTELAPELRCAALGQHMAATVQAAGMYTEIADLPQQVEQACNVGAWTIELRRCFVAASSIAALHACVTPPAPVE